MNDPLLQPLLAAAKAKNAGEVAGRVQGLDLGAHGSFDLLVTAIECKENGFGAEAERLLIAITRTDPGFTSSWYELGVLYRWSGRISDALPPLAEAHRLAPDDFRVSSMLAHMLYAQGHYAEAEQVIGRIGPTSPEEAAYIEPLREFGRCVQDFPIDRARELMAAVPDRYEYISTDQVAERIKAAIYARRGFSLVRLGDGEGAFARVDEVRFRQLYKHIRADWAKALFGAAFDPVATGYASIVSTLMDVSMEADIVGVHYTSWLEHEYRIASLRGVPCILNVARHLLANPPKTRPALCDQIIHIDLYSRGHIEPIMRAAKSIALISCLSGLPEMVKNRFGLEDVDLYKIPGEKYSEHLRTAESMDGIHFPYRYWEITKRLSQPLHGRVSLIAAGTLAKFYAATIKRNGGIALDFGSLVDGWMKIASRPGYDDRLAL